jgi:hypothetical protein
MTRALVFLTTILVMSAGFARAQNDIVEDAARTAQPGDEKAIRAFTDAVINDVPLRFNPSLSLNDRLFQAEVQYRQRTQPGVRLETLASALNQLATDLKLPAYVNTNVNQVRTYRMTLARVYPVFLSPLTQTTNQHADTVASPSAAMFLLLHLFYIKMTDPSSQIDPDAWVRDVEAKRKEAASHPPSRSVVFHVAKQSPKEQALARQYEALSREIASNSDRTVRPIQTLLTTIGL